MIKSIVTVIATIVAPILATFIGSLTTTLHANQSRIIGINSSHVWRKRRDVRAYASGVIVTLYLYGDFGAFLSAVLLAVLFYFVPAVVSMLLGRANVNRTSVYGVEILLGLLMTWLLTFIIGRDTKRYPLKITELGYSLRSSDFLYSAKFLKRNSFLLGMSIAIPFFLVMYTLAVAGTIYWSLAIIGMVTGLVLLALLIVGSVQSIQIVKDQLYLRAAILFINRVTDEVSPSYCVYCKCARYTICDRVSSWVSELRDGIIRLVGKRSRTTAKRSRPLIGPQPPGLDLVFTDFENQEPNDARVLYDTVLWKDGQTTFKVIELLDCRRLRGKNLGCRRLREKNLDCRLLKEKNLCVAQVDIHYLSSKDIELTAPELAQCDRVSSSRVRLVWVPDGYDTKFRKFFGLSCKGEDSH